LIVLNASRHHRKNRHSKRETRWRFSPVLNASRHQRKNRIYGPVKRHRKRRCSTPRGITGKIAGFDLLLNQR